ncbi:hypothetical protein FQZ97_581810 [compost metagenome]
MSAPAFTSARTRAWPVSVLPSVTSTLRNLGSLVISRSILSSAMWGLPSVGKAMRTACPARSSRAPTRTRVGASPTSPCRWTMSVGPASRCTRPSRQGSRSRKNRSLLWCSVVLPSSAPSPLCWRQRNADDRHLWQTSRGGYCTVPHCSQVCSSKRPSAAAAVRPSATRPRAPGGRFICRVRSTGFLRGGRIIGIVMRVSRE